MNANLTEKLKELKNTSVPPFLLRHTACRLAIALAFFTIYLSIGAAIFSAIETPGDLETIEELRSFRHRFLKQHAECLDDAELEAFIVRIVEANHRGVSAVRNVSADPNWSFGQSFFFAGTLVSTVGYGHVSPITQGGKAFTIIYALVGIPLTLSLLTALVDRLKVPSLRLLGFLNSRLGHLYQSSHIRFIHLLVLFSGVLLLLFIIPAAIFTGIEPGWSYLDAFYYCFISLTTIGLGDYIPGDSAEQRNRAVYKIFTTVYLLVGLCCMMLLLSTVYDIPQLNLGNFFLVKPDEQSANDPERLQLASKGLSGPNYSQFANEKLEDSTLPSPASTPSHFNQSMDEAQPPPDRHYYHH